MDFGYARLRTSGRDLIQQVEALKAAGVPEGLILSDRRYTGDSREGWEALLRHVRPHAGHRITVETLDRLGCTTRECLTLAHELTQQGIGLRTLADQLPIDTSLPGPAAETAVALLAMFARMERLYESERGAEARASQQARVASLGRRPKMSAQQQAAAAEMLSSGMSGEEVAAGFGVSRSTLFRNLKLYREAQAALGTGEVLKPRQARWTR
ncbi:recombinase family protein [Nonomuraea sp. NPDC026600]|uniref:recombinase family protein n=1 Tax=Nonomuraea sp. NPDC026600 TaxID=3155363 RepID=UPI0033FCD3BD